MTSRSYISKTIHPISMKLTGCTQQVVDINIQSILRFFKKIIILTFQWHSGGLLWPSRNVIQLEFLRNNDFKGINWMVLIFNET